eukprot:scaffold16470_cov17-Tisochrysis_lutea.AAC.1
MDARCELDAFCNLTSTTAEAIIGTRSHGMMTNNEAMTITETQPNRDPMQRERLRISRARKIWCFQHLPSSRL